MSAPNQDIDDLLSGMLDGMLTFEESIFLEREMANDPTLQARFDELSFLRRSLLSGRTVATLGPNFASFVTRSARARVKENEQAAAKPQDSGNPETAISEQADRVAKTPNHHRWLRWIYVGAVSIATCVVLLVFSMPKRDDSNVISDSDSVLEKQSTGLTETTSSDLAVSDDQLVREIAKDVVEKMDNRRVNRETVAEVMPGDAKQPALTDRRIADLKTVSPNLESDLNPKAIESNLLYYLYVLDVTVIQSAVEDRALERLLEKHQIVYTDDLAINDDQLAMLEKSKLTGGNSVANTDKMGVVFLRSSARRLGSAITDIIAQYQDFPEFAQNISTDRSATELVKQLSQIKVAESSGGVAQRFTLPKAPGVSYPFASSARGGKPISKEQRLENGKKQPLLSGDGMANALILLRPAKE